jgi:choline dehydrogenase
MQADIEADYVIVGAGSAGCVLASRLSEDGSSVLLLEAGPRDWYPLIHVPAGILQLLYNPRVNWNYSYEPDPNTGNRPLHCPRGKVLGGSSSINGMLYVRGNPADYDGWAQMGCTGWSYDEVLPFFRKSERYAPGDAAFRGKDGVLPVEDYRTVLPLTRRFVEAAQQSGIPFTPDMNGRTQEGVGYSQMTRNGRFRGSTARTFLAAARGRPGLRIETGAAATRLLFEGRRCIGVEFRQNGTLRRARAGRDVVLSGGAINSPQLLQLSGVGPAAHLQELGVPVLHDLPGVGANLSDHYAMRIAYRIRGLASINELSRGWRLAREAGRWLATGRGALTFGVTSASVFWRTREGLSSPDLQLLFTPASYDQNQFGALERVPGMTVAICAVRPESRGSVLARSADPSDYPAIRPNYLAAPGDVQVILAGLRLSRRILAAPALAPHVVAEIAPGAQLQTDEELTQAIRLGGGSLYHPVGTCKMGIDPMAVVDPRLRVHGIDGLRVVDASVMPTVTTGNTNAPSIMIGEKGAAMIREDARAAPAAGARSRAA